MFLGLAALKRRDVRSAVSQRHFDPRDVELHRTSQMKSLHIIFFRMKSCSFLVFRKHTGAFALLSLAHRDTHTHSLSQCACPTHYIYMYIHAHIDTHIPTYLPTYLHTYLPTYIRARTCIQQIHVRMHIHTHTNTHTHTQNIHYIYLHMHTYIFKCIQQYILTEFNIT